MKTPKNTLGADREARCRLSLPLHLAHIAAIVAGRSTRSLDTARARRHHAHQWPLPLREHIVQAHMGA